MKDINKLHNFYNENRKIKTKVWEQLTKRILPAPFKQKIIMYSTPNSPEQSWVEQLYKRNKIC